MPRYTDPQRAEIRTVVAEMYLLGYRIDNIRRFLSEKGISGLKLNMSRRQVERYLREVRTEFREAAKFVREEEIGKAIARLETQYRKADQGKDHRGAVLAQKQINVLLGLITHHIKHSGVLTLEDWLRGGVPAAVPGSPVAPAGDAAGGDDASAGDDADDGDDDDEPEPGRRAGGDDGEGGVGPSRSGDGEAAERRPGADT